MKTQAGFSWGSVGRENKAARRLTEKFRKKGFSKEQAKLKAVWTNPVIATICSEMPSVKILTSNVAAALDRVKLSGGDMKLLEHYARETSTGYCAGCAHVCESAYAGEAPISGVMRYLMYYHSYGDCERAKALFAALPMNTRKHMHTLDYFRAERRCPQGIPIGKLMKEAAEILA